MNHSDTVTQSITLEKLNYISGKTIEAAIDVHKHLGPGLLESVYVHCLSNELFQRGLYVVREVFVPVHYKGQTLDLDFRIDLLVENELVVEVKAAEALLPVHEAQLLTYLKLADKRLGLLINFNVPLLKDGIKRKINGY